MGSPWAQDPPSYATVEHFETSAEKDTSVTTVDNWHGWKQTRTVYVYHEGPVIIFDQAVGPMDGDAALAWHLAGKSAVRNQPITLANNKSAEMILLSLGSDETRIEMLADDDELTSFQLVPTDSTRGRLNSIAIFLTGPWLGAKAGLVQELGKTTLRIAQPDREIIVPLALDNAP